MKQFRHFSCSFNQILSSIIKDNDYKSLFTIRCFQDDIPYSCFEIQLDFQSNYALSKYICSKDCITKQPDHFCITCNTFDIILRKVIPKNEGVSVTSRRRFFKDEIYQNQVFTGKRKQLESSMRIPSENDNEMKIYLSFCYFLVKYLRKIRITIFLENTFDFEHTKMSFFPLFIYLKFLSLAYKISE